VLYVRFGGLPWMQALFYGIGAVVIAVIARSAVKLARLTLGRRRLLWAIFAALALSTAWTEREDASLVLAAGTLTLAVARRRSATAPGTAAVLGMTPLAGAATPTLAGLFWFFVKAGAFVFGSGLAIVPFLYGEVVTAQRWLDDRQFLDAVAIAMITPGPVVITVAFIGYLVAGWRGMAVAALGVFLPVYLFVVVPAPYFRKHRSQPVMKAFIDGVTAAATGAIAGAALVLASRAIVDGWTALMALVALAVLTRFRISELWVIAAAGAAGLALR
jgi:chromate transporter